MDCICVSYRGWRGKTKDLSAFEQGMVVGARHTSLFQELQRCWLFPHSTVSCVYQDWSTQRTSSQLDTTVGSPGPASLWNVWFSERYVLAGYPTLFPESCGKVVCKITIGQPHSHQDLRNICFSERYVLAGKTAWEGRERTRSNPIERLFKEARGEKTTPLDVGTFCTLCVSLS
jgi:hypothetical protein